MNATATAGRLRVRNGALKSNELATCVKEKLFEAKGVLEVQVNRRVGSVLVLFDKARISVERVMGRIATALGMDTKKLSAKAQSAQKAISGKKGRRYVKRGMIVALAAALGVVAYSEKWHVIAGGAFLTLLGAHLYQNRRTVLK